MNRRLAGAALAAAMLATGGGMVALKAEVAKIDREAAAWSLPPCPEEDSPGPCVWDAKARGNHQGRSFAVLADNTIIYLEDAR